MMIIISNNINTLIYLLSKIIIKEEEKKKEKRKKVIFLIYLVINIFYLSFYFLTNINISYFSSFYEEPGRTCKASTRGGTGSCPCRGEAG